jgi:hypothetical protein
VVHTAARTWSRTVSPSARCAPQGVRPRSARDLDGHKVLVSRDFRGGGEWEARFLRFSGAPLVGRKRASLWSVRSLRRGTARRCSAGHIVCSGERSESNGADYRPPPGGLAPSRDAVSRCDEDIGRITVASFGVTPTAGHTGRDPFFNLGLQPTHRVRGELATGRKLPPTLQTPECCPRQSRAPADLSASEDARW